MVGKWIHFHTNCNENNIYFFLKISSNFNVVTTCEFSIYYKIILLIFFFYKIRISTNSEKIILIFDVLSISKGNNLV
jgi:hypothetical protein